MKNFKSMLQALLDGDQDTEIAFVIAHADHDITQSEIADAREIIKNGDYENNAGAHLFLGLVLEDISLEQALDHLRRAIEFGSHTAAAQQMALYLTRSIFVKMDEEALMTAAATVRKAIDNNNSHAMYVYARIVNRMILGERNPQTAIDYYERAIALNHPIAMKYYALMLLEKGSFYSNPQRGIKLLEQAVQLGYLDALSYLASCYRFGTGVERDISRAAFLYRQYYLQTNDESEKDEVESILPFLKREQPACTSVLYHVLMVTDFETVMAWDPFKLLPLVANDELLSHTEKSAIFTRKFLEDEQAVVGLQGKCLTKLANECYYQQIRQALCLTQDVTAADVSFNNTNLNNIGAPAPDIDRALHVFYMMSPKAKEYGEACLDLANTIYSEALKNGELREAAFERVRPFLTSGSIKKHAKCISFIETFGDIFDRGAALEGLEIKQIQEMLNFRLQAVIKQFLEVYDMNAARHPSIYNSATLYPDASAESAKNLREEMAHYQPALIPLLAERIKYYSPDIDRLVSSKLKQYIIYLQTLGQLEALINETATYLNPESANDSKLSALMGASSLHKYPAILRK